MLRVLAVAAASTGALWSMWVLAGAAVKGLFLPAARPLPPAAPQVSSINLAIQLDNLVDAKKCCNMHI